MKRTQNKIQFLLYLLLILACSPLDIHAQAKPKEVNTQSQSWFSVNSTTRLSDKFGIMADVHVRRNNFLADPGFYFVRVGLNYWINENLTADVGYGRMWLAPSKPGWQHFAEENRVHQQIQFTSKVGKVNLMQRLRNELRWQEKIVNDQFIHEYKFTDRIRYLLSLNLALSKNKYYPSLVLSDELLIQFGKEIVYNTFDQNRLFIGVKQQLLKKLSFDMGYMVVFQEKATGYQYDKNNTFRLFFYYTPDLRKKKS